ncbi:MAG: polyprenyl synthetase family protein, partial [Candidatus Methanofastidiosia archaeon]
ENLLELLDYYESEKELAKIFSCFSFITCEAFGGEEELAEEISRVCEAFFLATSVHDDVVDKKDSSLNELSDVQKANNFMVLGDILFVKLAVHLSKASRLMSKESFQNVCSKLERYLNLVGKSQLMDGDERYKINSIEKAYTHIKMRGGIWGKIVMEIPALAASAPMEEAEVMGKSGELLFSALTIRDDLEDLEDELRNGVYTLPLILLIRNSEIMRKDEKLLKEFLSERKQDKLKQVMGLLYKYKTVDFALRECVRFCLDANEKLEVVLKDKKGMKWYMIKMIFQMITDSFMRITPEIVRKGLLSTKSLRKKLEKMRKSNLNKSL